MLTSSHYRKLAIIVLLIGLVIILGHAFLAAALSVAGAAAQTLPYPPAVPEHPLALLSFYLPAPLTLDLAGTCLVGAFILWTVSRYKAEMES